MHLIVHESIQKLLISAIWLTKRVNRKQITEAIA